MCFPENPPQTGVDFVQERVSYINKGELHIMTISMIGIDHDRAPVDIRALFAFTKKNAGEAMEKLKETAGIHGCMVELSG